MIYTKEFLISELHRFVEENGRNPRASDMRNKFGYPSFMPYVKYFGSWNNALIEAGLEINKVQTVSKLDGTETCDNCNKLKKDQWYYKQNQRLCMTCYNNLNNYIIGNLDPESNTGFGFIGQRIVAKILGLELKCDCNCSIGFNASYDLYDKEKFGCINVKVSTLGNDNAWHFNLKNKYTPDTYIMLGFSADKSDILHVWVTEPEDDLTFDEKKFKFKTGISIKNTNYSINMTKSWEVDCELYNDAYHNMSLENCTVLRSD